MAASYELVPTKDYVVCVDEEERADGAAGECDVKSIIKLTTITKKMGRVASLDMFRGLCVLVRNSPSHSQFLITYMDPF
ncbi:hypothetical protein LIER_28894 [Lithospermum erythrorhizon]|uniref:Uncharacterized protein n=1 Tax=Lithospermum erythrorhizon TaxID=34254 RepID=A0AAV3RKI1_LITER